jgi:hypothetical protein
MPPLRVEYAKSARAVCSLKECGKNIEKGAVRIGTGAMMPGVDDIRFKWRHLCCFTKRQLASAQSVDSIAGYEDLAPEDQVLVQRMVKGQLIGDASVMKPSAAAGTSESPSKKKHRTETDDDNAGDQSRGASPSPPTAGAGAGAVSSDSALPIGPDGRRICPYGELCFRIDPLHFKQCSHPKPHS